MPELCSFFSFACGLDFCSPAHVYKFKVRLCELENIIREILKSLPFPLLQSYKRILNNCKFCSSSK